jgi:hypothetical protein
MVNSYLTQNDVANYGNELLDMSQRAAMHAVAPILQNLEQQNAALQAQVARRRVLDNQVAELVPDYRTIDRNPAWHQWLLGADLLSGRIRQQLLNEAIQAGDVSRVKAIFDRFRQQGGQSVGGSRAPSRFRSANSDKPFYSRADITRSYEAHRRGAYNGREDDWNAIEQDLFAAQREGRIEQKPYFTK